MKKKDKYIRILDIIILLKDWAKRYIRGSESYREFILYIQAIEKIATAGREEK